MRSISACTLGLFGAGGFGGASGEAAGLRASNAQKKIRLAKRTKLEGLTQLTGGMGVVFMRLRGFPRSPVTSIKHPEADVKACPSDCALTCSESSTGLQSREHLGVAHIHPAS